MNTSALTYEEVVQRYEQIDTAYLRELVDSGDRDVVFVDTKISLHKVALQLSHAFEIEKLHGNVCVLCTTDTKKAVSDVWEPKGLRAVLISEVVLPKGASYGVCAVHDVLVVQATANTENFDELSHILDAYKFEKSMLSS